MKVRTLGQRDGQQTQKQMAAALSRRKIITTACLLHIVLETLPFIAFVSYVFTYHFMVNKDVYIGYSNVSGCILTGGGSWTEH